MLKTLQSDRCSVHHFKIRNAHGNEKAVKKMTLKNREKRKDLNQTDIEPE